MKHICTAAAALSLLSTAAFAEANYSLKGTSATDTNGNGNLVGTYSSSGTGNGGVVGGNGTFYDNSGTDQTNAPGSRAAAVQDLLGHDHTSNAGGNGTGRQNGR